MTTKTLDLEETIEELKKRVDGLQSDLQRQAEAAAERIAHEAPAFIERARAAGASVIDAGLEQTRGLLASGRRLWNVAGDGVSEAATAAEGTSRHTVVNARRFVRQRPLIAIGVAAAVGLVLGRALDWD